MRPTNIPLEHLSTESIQSTLTWNVKQFPTKLKIGNFIHGLYIATSDGAEKEYRCLYELNASSIGTLKYAEFLICKVDFDSDGKIVPKEYEVDLLNKNYFKNELNKAFNNILFFLDIYIERSASEPNICQQTLSSLIKILDSEKCEIDNGNVVETGLKMEDLQAMISDKRNNLRRKISDSILLLRINYPSVREELNGLIKEELINAFLKFEDELVVQNKILSDYKWIGNKADFAKFIYALEESKYFHDNIKYNSISTLKQKLVKRYSCSFSAADDMLKPNKLKAYKNKLGELFSRLSTLKITYGSK
jgi:hypothetical protein